MTKINLSPFFYFLCTISFLAAINTMGFILPDDLIAEANWTGAFWSAVVSIVCGISAKLMYNKHKFDTEDESPKFSELENSEKK